MNRLLTLPFLTFLLVFIILNFEGESESATARVAGEISYPEHLSGAFTGGFGEETCRSCHFDYDLNPNGGGMRAAGVPEKISAGEAVKIQIIAERKKLGAAGFQLSARHKDGSQAGRFHIEKNDQIMFTKAVPDSLQYVQHTKRGTKISEENTHSWTVKWVAPESADGTVIINIAVNTANGDQSEFEDYIYAEELEIEVR